MERQEFYWRNRGVLFFFQFFCNRFMEMATRLLMRTKRQGWTNEQRLITMMMTEEKNLGGFFFIYEGKAQGQPDRRMHPSIIAA